MPSPNTSLPADVAEAARDPARRFGPDGRYVLLQELGAGGMGRVWKGFDSRLGRHVAIKGLYRLDPESLARFQREAALAARLRHPGIVSVHDVGEQDGQPYLVMDLINGAPPHKASLDLRAKAAAIRDAARGVHFAHTQGVLHRDLKPSNLMIDAAGRTLVMDFGLAREVRDADGPKSDLTLTGDVLGTPAYMSPEQAQGRVRELDARTDVYGLGATLYHLAAGWLPHNGRTAFEVLRSVIEADPPSPCADPDLDKVVMKAMEKDPARRYATAEALANDLDRWLRGDPVTATRASWTYRARRRIRRNPWAWAGLAAAVVALAAGSAFAASEAVRHNRRRRALLLYEQAQSSFHAALLDLLTAGSIAEAHMAEFARKLAEAKRLDPGFDRGHFEHAQYWRLAGDEVKAWAHLEEGLAREPEHPAGRAERGMLLAARYRRELVAAHADAIREEGARAREERRAPRRFSLADVERERPALARLKREALAEIRAGTARTRDAEPPWVQVTLAELDLMAGNLEAAEARAVPVEYAWGKLLRGRVAEARNDPGTAEEWYGRAVATQRTCWDGWEARASLRARVGFAAWEQGDEGGRAKVAEAVEDWGTVVAGAPFRATARTGRSGACCQLGEIVAGRGEDPTALYEQALADAAAALDRDAADVAALYNQGHAYHNLGGWRAARGEDPSAAFLRAVESFDAARSLRPDDSTIYSNRGNAYLGLGRWQAGRGEDPTEAYDRAAESYGAALARNPEYAAAFNNQGIAHNFLGEWQANQGVDPHASCARAIESFDAALVRDPEYAAAYNNRGTSHLRLGEWEAARGRDPTEPYARAIDSLDAALAVNPEYADAYNSRGAAHSSLGEWRARRGEDPTPDYSRAIESFTAALARNPQEAFAYNNLGGAHLRLGVWQASREEDPTGAYAHAIESFDAALARNPRSVPAYYNRGSAYLCLGQWRPTQGRDPTEEYARAIESFDAALARNPEYAGAFNERGIAYRYTGDWVASQGGDPTEAYARAIESYGRATAIDPLYWEAHANQGLLHRAAGRWPEALRAFEAAHAVVGDGYPRLRALIDEARSHVEPEY